MSELPFARDVALVHCAHPRWRRGPVRTGRSSGSAARFSVTIAAHSAERPGEVHVVLNSGPRKCRPWETHAAVVARLQSDHSQAKVATFDGTARPSVGPDLMSILNGGIHTRIAVVPGYEVRPCYAGPSVNDGKLEARDRNSLLRSRRACMVGSGHTPRAQRVPYGCRSHCRGLGPVPRSEERAMRRVISGLSGT